MLNRLNHNQPTVPLFVQSICLISLNIGEPQAQFPAIGVARFSEHTVILCFERLFSKRDGVIRLKLKILFLSKFFGPSNFLDWVCHYFPHRVKPWSSALFLACRDLFTTAWDYFTLSPPGGQNKLVGDLWRFYRRTDNQCLRAENQKARDESDLVRSENSKLRDENKKLRLENQDLRNENGALRSENQKVRNDNVNLREEAGEMRNENMKVSFARIFCNKKITRLRKNFLKNLLTLLIIYCTFICSAITKLHLAGWNKAVFATPLNVKTLLGATRLHEVHN